MKGARDLIATQDDLTRIPLEGNGMPTGAEVEGVIETINDAAQVIRDAGILCDHVATGLRTGFINGDDRALVPLLRMMSRVLLPTNPDGTPERGVGIADRLGDTEFVLRRLKPV